MRRRRRAYRAPVPYSAVPRPLSPQFKVTGDAPSLLDILPHMSREHFPSQVWSSWSAPERAAEFLATATYHLSTGGQDNERDSFYGNLTKADALDMVRTGWQEGASRVARLRDRINAKAPHGPRLTKWDVAGVLPSVPRALAGNPMNMKRFDSARLRRRPVITLVNHMGGLAEVGADCFVNKCAVVAAIVDVVENAGYSVHLIGMAMSQSDKHLAGTVFELKAPGQHVDVARMAFALGHVAMFRRIVFGLRASDPANVGKLAGMGHTTDFRDTREGVFVLPSMNTNYQHFTTEDYAATRGLNYYMSELAKQGCPCFA